MAQVTLTQAQISAGLTQTGFRLASNQFTFSLPGTGSVWPGYAAGTQPTTSYSVLSIAQAAAFRAALATWDELVAPNFTEVADDANSRGELRVAFTAYDMDSDTAAYAFSGSPQPPGGRTADIWINADMTGESFGRGSYNFEVLVHELGHTLGLKHSFEAPVIPAPFENRRYTVMSYTDPPATTIITFVRAGASIRADFAFATDVTPMVLDIAAVQATYGADMTTRAGATTYAFNQDDSVLQSIYDAGGEDVIDLSSFTRSSTLDLTPGAYSSIGEWGLDAQIAYWTAQFPAFASFIRTTLTARDLYLHTDNLGIALSTVIENAIGGSAADRISGNAAANRLSGGGGGDTLSGGDADDILAGGSGDDVLTGGAGADLFVFGQTGDGADRITDFAIASDRFDLGGRGFTAIAESGGNTVLTHSGGTVRLDGVVGLTLAQANARVAGLRPVLDAQLLAILPDDGSTGVPVTAPIRLVFAAAVARGSGAVTLATADGTVIETIDAASARLTIAGNVVTIDPARPLVPGTGYTLGIGAGTVSVGGAAYGGLSGYDFTSTATSIADVSQYFLVMPSGSVALAQGSGDVFGDAGKQQVTIANTPGKIVLDGSFNRGGDLIQLAGAASDYSVVRSGSSVLLNDGDSIVQLPVGLVGADVQFADRLLTLKFTTAQATAIGLGDQIVTTASAQVTAAGGAATATGAVDASLVSQLIVTSGGRATASGVLQVFGGIGTSETVRAAGSAIEFDGSFNSGGDVMILGGRASDYSAVRTGSTMVLSGAGQTVAIPVGVAGATVRFADGDRALAFERLAGGGVGAIKLGDQSIGTSAVAVTAVTTVAGSLDQDSDGNLATVFGIDASTANIRFTDADATAQNVRLIGFGRGDQIVLQGVASDYVFAANGGDLTILKLGAGGVLATTAIAGLADPASVVLTVDDARAAAGFDFVTFTV